MPADPTIDDMRQTLITNALDADEFGREEAIYWFASDYHGGQASNLYTALCASSYKPGACARSPELGESDCYDILVLKYASDTL